MTYTRPDIRHQVITALRRNYGVEAPHKTITVDMSGRWATPAGLRGKWWIYNGRIYTRRTRLNP